MDPIDRMTIDLLNHYAFTLHEDVTNLTDDEINKAKEFATNYLNNNFKWKDYDPKFSLFVSEQTFNAITGNDFSQIKVDLYQKILSLNNLMNVYDWFFEIYYDIDIPDCLLLSKRSSFPERIDLTYNFKDKVFRNFEKEITNEMYKLSHLYYDCMNVDGLDGIKI